MQITFWMWKRRTNSKERRIKKMCIIEFLWMEKLFVVRCTRIPFTNIELDSSSAYVLLSDMYCSICTRVRCTDFVRVCVRVVFYHYPHACLSGMVQDASRTITMYIWYRMFRSFIKYLCACIRYRGIHFHLYTIYKVCWASVCAVSTFLRCKSDKYARYDVMWDVMSLTNVLMPRIT